MTRKKKQTSAFQPFVHENLELKNELVELARSNINDDAIEKRLSAVLIYSNIAEYLAENLLDNLNHFIFQNSYKSFWGILYIETASWNSTRTLGQIIPELKKFSFPDKEWILNCLQKIVESRNKIFHNFWKSDIDTMQDLLTSDLPTIASKTEEFIRKINTVYWWLQKILSE